MTLAHFLTTTLLAAFAATTVRAAEVKCPIVFDGRVPASLAPADFDAPGRGSPFNTGYVKGEGLKWSDILKFPSGQAVGPSRFEDGAASSQYKPVTVTLSDKSIFQTQKGFRRAGLQFNGDTNTGGQGSTGVKTLHWSVKIDPGRALNLSHEYLVGFLFPLFLFFPSNPC
ncbi:hypothetical protein MAPG_03385 [Magnaporthiopsis poae ATCC 64411]|uniref:Glycoside hydrolase 131 catalytic N-terminal domain-containing protein n=1 Tax=Magnaporthiopsis poae (strain ATCC 64411 / 73-15) TaxID=644358 RepID=A0A0C4DTV8_MAGP6|nr:hypothetical protein MAPG_03385 [Magnaporthiopsis poae ATCC 64411]